MGSLSIAHLQDRFAAVQARPQCEAVAIRSAEPADIAALIEIERASFSDPWAPDTVAGSLHEPRTIILVAAPRDAEDGVAGYGRSGDGVADYGICGYAVAWTVGDEGEIAHLAVAPATRSRGIGARLLAGLLDECVRRGARQVFLEVRRSNEPARRLYERAGFTEVGVRRRYYRDGEDAVTMRWDASALQTRTC